MFWRKALSVGDPKKDGEVFVVDLENNCAN
jgi:hypothetical protein